MPVQFQDYYGILGIPRTSTPDEIKKAFRKLAMVYHPDVARDKVLGTVKFREVREAYEVLSSPAQRQKYDEIDAARQDASRVAPPAPTPPPRDPSPNYSPPNRDRGFRINFDQSTPQPPEPFEAEFSEFYKAYFTRSPDQSGAFRDNASPDNPRNQNAPRKSAKWFYRTAIGHQKGPFEFIELAAMLRCGDITGATPTRTDGDSWTDFQDRHEFEWAREMPTEVIYRHLDAKTESAKTGFSFTFRNIYYLFAMIVGVIFYAIYILTRANVYSDHELPGSINSFLLKTLLYLLGMHH